MLKREIKYTDFDGDQQSDTFYFNLTATEIVEMEVEIEGGLGEFLQKIVKEENNKELYAQFKKIILKAYGEKSPDGKRFVKSEELCTEFAQTAAFDALVMEFFTKEDAAATFINGIMPKDLPQSEVAKLPPPNIVPAETLRNPIDTTATDQS